MSDEENDQLAVAAGDNLNETIEEAEALYLAAAPDVQKQMMDEFRLFLLGRSVYASE